MQKKIKQNTRCRRNPSNKIMARPNPWIAMYEEYMAWKEHSWGVTTLPYYERISPRDLGTEEIGIFGTEMILTFPSSFSVGMM